MPLVLAGVGIEHDHAMVAIAIGDIQFIGLRIDERLRRQPQIVGVVAALALARLADLHQELAVLRELQSKLSLHGARPRPSCSHPAGSVPPAAGPRPLPPIQTLPL